MAAENGDIDHFSMVFGGAYGAKPVTYSVTDQFINFSLIPKWSCGSVLENPKYTPGGVRHSWKIANLRYQEDSQVAPWSCLRSHLNCLTDEL